MLETEKSETLPTMPNERPSKCKHNQINRKYLMMKHAKNSHSRERLDINKVNI